MSRSPSTLDQLLTRFGTELRDLVAARDERIASLEQALETARNPILPVVMTLVELLEGRDEFTYGHSRRIAHLSVQLATHLGWPPERIRMLHIAGLLHDIGMVIVPDAVLQKEGKYTSEEFETMKLHASTGGRILHRLGFIGEEIELWVQHHHERYDGAGYPDGLAGDQIPVGARIIALADAYDAMVSPRRYKQRLTHFVALDEIGICGGRQFDPQLALAFQEAFQAPPEY